jgi:hypothetical protein
VLTQLSCGACLLIGTIGLVLVEQNHTGGLPQVIAWLVMAMAGLVFGGLIYRGGLVSMLIAAAIDAGFGVLLVTFELDNLRRLLKILRPSDVDAIHSALTVAGFAMIGAGVLCLVALPQGVRYARWFRDAAVTRSAMSTARGFPPPPIPARTAAFIIPAEDQPASRRRLYMALGGVAIGVGAGIGVLVSSTRSTGASRPRGAETSTTASTAPRAGSGSAAPVAGMGSAVIAQAGGAPGAGAGSGSSAAPKIDASGARIDARPPGIAAPSADGERANPGAGSGSAASPGTGSGSSAGAGAGAGAGSGSAASPGAGSGSGATVAPIEHPVQDLVVAQHAAFAAVDRRKLADLIASTCFSIGIDADEIADGRAAVLNQVSRDLGDPPRRGFTIASRGISIGQERDHAWIAEQLEVSAPDRDSRSFAISELAAIVDGRWQIVALHFATPVGDATAERLAILSQLPAPAKLADRPDPGAVLDQAVRSAFASRTALADALSDREDTFNYGSGGERAHGGAALKKIFGKLRAEIKIHDGARIATGGSWDAAQVAAPWIGYAALNVDFTTRSRAATDVTQTFRVLAVLLKEPTGWKIVQTQWSNGGPIR